MESRFVPLSTSKSDALLEFIGLPVEGGGEGDQANIHELAASRTASFESTSSRSEVGFPPALPGPRLPYGFSEHALLLPNLIDTNSGAPVLERRDPTINSDIYKGAQITALDDTELIELRRPTEDIQEPSSSVPTTVKRYRSFEIYRLKS